MTVANQLLDQDITAEVLVETCATSTFLSV